jgi:hypothetical protein
MYLASLVSLAVISLTSVILSMLCTNQYARTHFIILLLNVVYLTCAIQCMALLFFSQHEILSKIKFDTLCT